MGHLTRKKKYCEEDFQGFNCKCRNCNRSFPKCIRNGNRRTQCVARGSQHGASTKSAQQISALYSIPASGLRGWSLSLWDCRPRNIKIIWRQSISPNRISGCVLKYVNTIIGALISYHICKPFLPSVFRCFRTVSYREYFLNFEMKCVRVNRLQCVLEGGKYLAQHSHSRLWNCLFHQPVRATFICYLYVSSEFLRHPCKFKIISISPDICVCILHVYSDARTHGESSLKCI